MEYRSRKKKQYRYGGQMYEKAGEPCRIVFWFDN